MATMVAFASPRHDLIGTPERSYGELNQSSEFQDGHWRELASVSRRGWLLGDACY